MNFRDITANCFLRAAMGGGLAVILGLALWLGGVWENASYDQLFRFGARPITNQLALILMNNEAYADAELGQQRTQAWSRTLHTKLLNKLAADKCPMVVFDVFFRKPGDPTEDEALADAMRRQRQVALVAVPALELESRVVEGEQMKPPTEPFLSAARANVGIAKVNTNDIDGVVRRHWPFPSPGRRFASLPETAARLAGAQLDKASQKKWLRYYGTNSPWEYFGYGDALLRSPTNAFSGSIVFIGREPEKPKEPGVQEDEKFHTPYTRRGGKTASGVEILATQFLNLLNGDWLRRPPWWVEVLGLSVMGMLLGGGLCLVRLWLACLLAVGAGLTVILGAASLSYFSNFWFPWLVIAGGQVPVALTWAIVVTIARPRPQTSISTVVVPQDTEVSDFERFGPPFGEGGFGKVWVVRNAIGQWQALKEVYKTSFGDDVGKFEMEFNGIQKYKPISHKHSGLLRIEFVSREKRAGFFYYVMELGDPLDPESGWEQNPTLYKPRDLRTLCARAERKRLPVRQCLEIGLKLADALDFLHREGLTHRDIKPGNVIFVNGQPKLADAGTVTVLRPPEQINTHVVSRGYTPPGEPPGTKQADIYSLGKLLYVISTGRDPQDDFPALSTTLIESTKQVDFMGLNKIIIKACQPNPAERYASATEMREDFQRMLDALK